MKYVKIYCGMQMSIGRPVIAKSANPLIALMKGEKIFPPQILSDAIQQLLDIT